MQPHEIKSFLKFISIFLKFGFSQNTPRMLNIGHFDPNVLLGIVLAGNVLLRFVKCCSKLLYEIVKYFYVSKFIEHHKYSGLIS